MFRTHSIILDPMDVDPLKIKEEKFQALELLKTERKDVVDMAKHMRSFAHIFHFLCQTFQQIKHQHQTIER